MKARLLNILKKLLSLRVLAVLGVVVLLLAAFLYFLLGTTKGARTAVSVVNSLLEGVVSVKADITEGSLWRGFKTQDGLVVELPEIIKISASDFDLAYSLHGIFEPLELEVDHIKADDLTVALDDALFAPAPEGEEISESAGDEEPFKLNFPLKINLKELLLHNFTLQSQIIEVKIGSARLSALAEDNSARLLDGEASDVTAHLKNEDWEDDPNAPSEPVWVESFDGGDGAIATIGPIELPLQVGADHLEIKRGRYYMAQYDTGLVDAVLDGADWRALHLKIDRLQAGHELGEVEVSGALDFDEYLTMDFALKGQGGNSQAAHDNYGGLLPGLSGEGKVQGPLTDLKAQVQINTPQRLQVSARMNVLSSLLPCELELSSQGLNYPLSVPYVAQGREEQSDADWVAQDEVSHPFAQTKDREEVSAEQDAAAADSAVEQQESAELLMCVEDLHLKGAGSLERGVDSELTAHFKGFESDVDVALKAKVGLSGTDIGSLDISGNAYKAPLTLTLQGRADYAESVGFAGSVQAASGNLGGLHELLAGPAALDTALTLKVGDALELAVDTLQASATLNALKADLHGNNIIYDSSGVINIGALSFVQGSNHLDARGALSEQNSKLEADWAFDDLSELDPAITGTVTGRLQLSGSYALPDIELVGDADNLDIYGTQLHGVVVNAKVEPGKEKGGITVLANAVKFSEDLKPSRQCSVDLSGTLDHHRLSMGCGGVNGGIISLNGGFDKTEQLWQGELTDLVFSSEYTNPIALQHHVPVTVDIDDVKGSVGELLLTGSAGNIRLAGTTFTQGNVRTALDITDYDLKNLARFLPEDAKVKGTIALHADVEVKNGRPDIDAVLTSEKGRASFSGVYLGYDSLKLEAGLHGEVLSAGTDIQLSRSHGHLNTALKVSDLSGARQLSGDVKLDALDLEIFAGAGGGFNELTGKLNVDGQLGGTLRAPLFNGQVQVQGSAEPHYDIGRIDNFDFKLQARGNQGTLTGLINLNEGELKLDGDLNWQDSAGGTLTLSSHELPLFLMGYGICYIDMDVKAALLDHLDVRGLVSVPRGIIQVKSVESGGVSPSKDEIIVGENGTQELIKKSLKAEPPLNSYMDLVLKLGNALKVDAMGLKADVRGEVTVKKDINDKDLDARGKIYLHDGQAQVYGHNFIVNRAETQFTGDITNPQLNVEVVVDPRDIQDDVTAGVRVLGSATDFNIELFSKPAMSDNEVLSYILYGHGLDKDSDNPENSSTQLLMAMGLGTTTGLVNDMAGALGMKNVQFRSSGSGDSTQVGVQSYITNRIMVGYGYGVFTSVGEFRVRYEILRKLYLEFVSSIDQAVDLIYSFEFN